MVIVAKLPRFARQQEGVVVVEALLVFPLVLLAFAAFFEFGYAVFQWNQTVKALQYGTRMLTVSEPLLDLDLNDKGGPDTPEKRYSVAFAEEFDDGYTDDGTAPVPAAIIERSCGAGTTPCDAEKMNRLVFGATASGTNSACGFWDVNTIPGMCDFNSRIGVENVLVTYYRAGLGYQGRPFGPALTLRVEVKDISFDLPFLGALLGLDTIAIPAHPVTITSEDLCSVRSC